MAKYPSLFVGQRWTADLASSALDDTVVKTVTTSRASTVTLTSDPDFQFAVAADALYRMEMNLQVTGSNTGDFQFGFSGPTGAGLIWNSQGIVAAGSLYTDDQMFTGAMGSTITNGIITGLPVPIFVVGMVDTASTAGTFALRWAQGTSNATATNIIAGSHMQLTRVG